MRGRRIKRALTVIGAGIALAYVALLLTNLQHELPMNTQEADTTYSRVVAVFGATGTIGDGLLQAAMDDSNVEKILVVTRRLSPRIERGIGSGKVEAVIHKDYLDYSAIKDRLADVDAVYWAIGLSAVGLDQETYREIHVEFPTRFVATWLGSSERPETSFHYVSGSGAKAESRMMWAREKARAEVELAELAETASLRVFSYRPAFIRPTEVEAHFGHKLLHAIMKPIGASVAAEAIGAAMLEVSSRSSSLPNGTVLENKDINLLSDAYGRRGPR